MLFLPILPPSGKSLELTECGRGFFRILFGWLWVLAGYILLTLVSDFILPTPITIRLLSTVGITIVLSFAVHVIVYVELHNKEE